MQHLSCWLIIWALMIFSNNYLLLSDASKDWCLIHEEHIMCDVDRKMSSCSNTVEFFPKLQREKKEMIQVINTYRNKIAGGSQITDYYKKKTRLPKAARMAELVWSDTLEEAAYNQANDCEFHTLPCEALNIDGLQVEVIHNEIDERDVPSSDVTREEGGASKTMKVFNHALFEDAIWGRLNFTVDGFRDPDAAFMYRNPLSFLISDRVNRVGCKVSKWGTQEPHDYRVFCVLGSVDGILHKPLFEEGVSPCSNCPPEVTCSQEFPNLCDCTETTCILPLVSVKTACNVTGTENSAAVVNSESGRGNDNEESIRANRDEDTPTRDNRGYEDTPTDSERRVNSTRSNREEDTPSTDSERRVNSTHANRGDEDTPLTDSSSNSGGNDDRDAESESTFDDKNDKQKERADGEESNSPLASTGSRGLNGGGMTYLAAILILCTLVIPF